MSDKKKITNIVKFSVNDVVGSTTVVRTQAAVFYDDGSVEMLPMEDAIELSKNEKVKMKQTTPDELEKNFQSYFTPTISSRKRKKATSKEKIPLFKRIKNGLEKGKSFILKLFTLFYENILVKGCEYATLHLLQRDKLKQMQEEDFEAEEELRKHKGIFSRFKKEGKKKNFFSKFKKKKAENTEKKSFFSKLKRKKIKNRQKKSFFSRLKKKKTKSKTKLTKKRKRIFNIIKAAVVAISLTIVGGFVSSCHKQNSPQDSSKSKVETTSNDLDNLTKNEIINLIKEYKLTADQVAALVADGKISNDDFSSLSYEQLLYISTDKTQQTVMQKISSFIDKYNIDFADKCLDTNAINIRASLTWDEVNALNLAYNDYSQDQVKSIFNDAEVIDFTNAYKEGYLQLLGAYVVANDNNPIQLSQLIDGTEGKEFVNKYESSYYEIKKLTGDAKINSVNIFLQKVIDDFSINAKDTKNLESYKLAVVPIVGATISLCQNLEVNQINLEQVTAYFNNLGLYDQAEENLNMSKSLTGEESEENPTYQQFKDEKIEEQQEAKVYYVNDRNRDLSQLSSFQSLVEWYFNIAENGDLKVGNTLDECIVEPEKKVEQSESKLLVKEVQSENDVLSGTSVLQVQSSNNVNINSRTQSSTNNDDSIYGNSYNDYTSNDYVANNVQTINTVEESVDTEGVEVDYNPGEELNNFQVNQVGGQTIFSYDEESEEQVFQEQSQEPSDENASEIDEESTQEVIPEDYIVTQMPESDIYILEYEEIVEETPEMTNEEQVEAIVQDMVDNPDNYVDQTSYSETSEFVYQR